MRFRHAVWTVGAVALLLSLGCDDRTKGQVSGTVTFDNTPVEKGSITFWPLDGKGSTVGGVITDGKFSVANVPVGATKVVITGVKFIGEVKKYDTPDSPMMKKVAPLLPPKYSDINDSELRYEVAPGANEKDFDLTSK